MNRKDFLKTVFLLIAGATILRWLKPWQENARLTEARFYGPADHLGG